MDTVFIRGFVSSRCKHTLCTHRFPCRPSDQVQGPDGLPGSLILHPLPTGFTPASEVTSQPSRLGDRPGITSVKFVNDLFACLDDSFHHTGGGGWIGSIQTGARRQLEHVLASCVKGNGRGGWEY